MGNQGFKGYLWDIEMAQTFDFMIRRFTGLILKLHKASRDSSFKSGVMNTAMMLDVNPFRGDEGCR